jgi:hypothetical protein
MLHKGGFQTMLSKLAYAEGSRQKSAMIARGLEPY